LWLTATFAPIEFNTAVDHVGILSSAYMGEILFWPWKWNGRYSHNNDVLNTNPIYLNNDNYNIKHGHNRPVFDILVNNRIDDGPSTSLFSFITNSMDRKVIAWKNTVPIRELPGFGGYIYDMNFSKVMPNLCAIAVGDRTIRVWDTSDDSDLRRSTTHWNGLQSEVTSVCWHPTKDGFLAYGTSDGSVGVFDVLKDKNHPFRNETNSSIKNIEFRNGNIFYALCDSGDLLEIMIHNLSLFDQNNNGSIYHNSNGDVGVLNINSKLSLGSINDKNKSSATTNDGDIISTFSWVSNIQHSAITEHDILAVGYKDGRVNLFKLLSTINFSTHDFDINKSKLCNTLFYQNQKINDIKWYDYNVHVIDDRLVRLFATASNDRTVRVFSYSVSINAEVETSMNDTQQPLLKKISEFATFVGHQKPVVKLAWHPNKQDVLLASASKDGTANVWDVLKREPLANCRGGHGAALKCIVWSTINQCMLYTGSDDQSVIVWDIYNQNDSSTPPTKDSLYHKAFSKRLKNNKLFYDQKSGNNECNDQSSNSMANETKIFPKRGNGNKRKTKTILPSLKGANTKLMELLNSVDQRQQTKADLDSNNTWQAIEKNEVLLDEEITNHRARGAYEAGRSLEVWRGDITVVVQRMIEEKRLTADFVALSVSGGAVLWKTAVEAYAKQLEQKGDVHTAVIYFLSISRVYDAIDMYVRARLYRDALSLAIARLSPADPVISLICKELGKCLEKQGHLIEAQEAFLIAGEEERANASEKKRESRQVLLLEKAKVNKLPLDDVNLIKQPDSAKINEAEIKLITEKKKSQGNLREEDMKSGAHITEHGWIFSDFKQMMKFGTGNR
jgi:WD40 repeat protein